MSLSTHQRSHHRPSRYWFLLCYRTLLARTVGALSLAFVLVYSSLPRLVQTVSYPVDRPVHPGTTYAVVSSVSTTSGTKIVTVRPTIFGVDPDGPMVYEYVGFVLRAVTATPLWKVLLLAGIVAVGLELRSRSN